MIFNFLKLKKQLNMAKRSDASMSKYSEKLNGEEKMTKGFAKKRKVTKKRDLI